MVVKRKQRQIEELQKRFDDHMLSNANTEKSLYERISDLQNEIGIMKKLREEDKIQLQVSQRHCQEKDEEIHLKLDQIEKIEGILKQANKRIHEYEDQI